MKGPGIFLAQFLGDEVPFNSLDTIAKLLAFVARRNDESSKELTQRIKALEAEMGNLGKRLKSLAKN